MFHNIRFQIKIVNNFLNDLYEKQQQTKKMILYLHS